MRTRKQTITYTFVNPNTADSIRNTLKKIVLDKLLSFNIEELTTPN